MDKLKLLARRLLQALPSLAAIVIITFLLTRLLPGDPAAYFAGDAADAESIAQVRAELGLDRPLVVQFFVYLGDLLRGDLGTSLNTGRPVLAEIANRLPASLELTGVALLLALGVAVPLGVLAALYQDRWVDHLCRVVVTAGVSLPTFFTGLLLIYIFYYILGWAPSPLGRLDFLYIPPATVTGFYTVDALLAGDLATVLITYAFRNALLPVLTTLGMVFSFMLGANVLVEQVFAWPGIGSFAVEALVASDYAAVQGFVLVMAILFVALNLVIDMIYTLIDPRVAVES